MKCNVSPITSNAANVAAGVRAPRNEEEVALFTTLLVQSALKPLSASLGTVGDAVTSLVAQQVGHGVAERGVTS